MGSVFFEFFLTCKDSLFPVRGNLLLTRLPELFDEVVNNQVLNQKLVTDGYPVKRDVLAFDASPTLRLVSLRQRGNPYLNLKTYPFPTHPKRRWQTPPSLTYLIQTFIRSNQPCLKPALTALPKKLQIEFSDFMSKQDTIVEYDASYFPIK